MALLLAQRQLSASEIASFLNDPEPRLVADAVRAIHDTPLAAVALPQLAALTTRLSSFDDTTGRRVLNARFRLGRAEDAEALADVATSSDVSPILRREALALLSEWSKPSPVERVYWCVGPTGAAGGDTGHCGGPPRVLSKLMQSAPIEVAAVAVALAAQYKITEAVDTVSAVARDTAQSPANRAAAVRASTFLPDSRANSVARELLVHASPLLRAAGRDLLVARDSVAALDELSAVFRSGTLTEQQSAATTLRARVEPRAYNILNAQAGEVAQGKLPLALALDLHEALDHGTSLSGLNGERSRRQSQFSKQQEAWKATLQAGDPLRVYRMALEGGDVPRGRDLFYTKVEFQCVRCHRVGGSGTSDVGPDLTGIGGRQSREYLLRSIVDPGAEIAPGFVYTTLTLTDGSFISGVLHSESATDLRLVTTGAKPGETFSVPKLEIKSRVSASAMPPLVSRMTLHELRDLVEYLVVQSGTPKS
ncbi:MAG: c-type cytochrome [Opitutaceae bacterium]|nr:c-type cytochrome [Opitutaceae bacterium]